MSTPNEPQSGSAARLREVAAGLAEMGLVTRLQRTRAGTDLTATLHLPGYHEIEVIADEDGYTELRYWCSLSSTPAADVATIARLLETLTTSQSLAIRARPTYEPVAGYDGAVTERAEGVGMTGPHDDLAEQGRTPDQARPHTADNPHDSQVRPDDLQTRLERLPLNHPSSPYRDDGSRKPPPPTSPSTNFPSPTSPTPFRPRLTRRRRSSDVPRWHLGVERGQTLSRAIANSGPGNRKMPRYGGARCERQLRRSRPHA